MVDAGDDGEDDDDDDVWLCTAPSCIVIIIIVMIISCDHHHRPHSCHIIHTCWWTLAQFTWHFVSSHHKGVCWFLPHTAGVYSPVLIRHTHLWIVPRMTCFSPTRLHDIHVHPLIIHPIQKSCMCPSCNGHPDAVSALISNRVKSDCDSLEILMTTMQMHFV